MSNRRLDIYNIVISGDDLPVGQSEIAYFDSVEANLKSVARYVTGQAILYKIKAHGQVLVLPFKPTPGTDACNAMAKMLPQNKKSANPVAQVLYSPAIWKQSPCSKQVGGLPDVALLHELVHAGRQLGLDFKPAPLSGALARYDNEEEFFAVLVENIYISESGRRVATGLRADHRNGQLLPPDDDPEVWLSNVDHFNLVEKYCDQHPKISKMLCDVKAEFNPIHTYYAWDKKLPDYPIVRIPVN